MDDHDQATTEDCVSCQTNRLGAENQPTLGQTLCGVWARRRSSPIPLPGGARRIFVPARPVIGGGPLTRLFQRLRIERAQASGLRIELERDRSGTNARGSGWKMLGLNRIGPGRPRFDALVRVRVFERGDHVAAVSGLSRSVGTSPASVYHPPVD